MTLPVGDLLSAIERNDGLAVSRYIRGATEAERRRTSGKVRALCEGVWNFQGDRSATVVAMLGTAGGARQVARVIGPIGVEQWTNEAIAVLEERKPGWLPDLPQALLTGNDFRNKWCFVRSLVRARLVSKPEIDEYVTLMPLGLAGRAVGWPHFITTDMTIEVQLRDDPDLLHDEVFRLFRVDGCARTLYWADGMLSPGRRWEDGKWVNYPPQPEATWRATLARLARQGVIDFDRLLEESIAVFLRDLRPTHFGWYVDFHDELAPTVEEMAPRAEQYQRLLAAETSLGAGVGQRALEQLLRVERLNVESFVRASGPALARGEKGIVVKQLKLLAVALKQRPDLAALVRDVLWPALTHERPEIQEAARALADRLPVESPPPLQELVRTRRTQPQSEPSESMILARARRLTGESQWASAISSTLAAVEAGGAPPVYEIPVGPGQVLPPPIADPEEVIEAFTRLVENADDALLIERAIAGAVRTARIPVEQRLKISAALAKRAREQLPGWRNGLTSGDVRAIAASVAYTWSTGTRVIPSFDSHYVQFSVRYSSLDEHFQPVTPTGTLAVRCIEAIDVIANGVATELLAEPTHDRGAVDPEAFLERAQRSYGGWLGQSPLRYDLETAALRIRPGAADAAASKLPRSIKDQATRLLNDVAAWNEAEIVSGKPQDRWSNAGSVVVLARVMEMGARSTILKRMTSLGDPIGSYVRLSDEGEFTTGYGSAIRTWPLVCPWLPELTAAHLLRPLSRALQPGKHDYGPSALRSLLHSDTPLGKIGHMALAMACVGAEADTRTAAGDVFAAASKDGRLQPALMADAWLELAGAGAFQAKRLESALRPVSNLPACGMRTAQSLQLALGPLLDAGVRDMHALVRLAASVGNNYGVFPNDAAFENRARPKTGTELVKSLHALAAVRGSSGKLVRAASLDLLEGLLERAER